MGSEEYTLEVVTKIGLPCWPKPISKGIAMAVLITWMVCPNRTWEVYQAGILPSGNEILDSSATEAVNQFKPNINFPMRKPFPFLSGRQTHPSGRI